MSTDKLVRGIRNFSVAHPSEALQKSSPRTFDDEVKIGTKVNTNKLNANEEFLFWFSGFTDGEGNFSIFLYKVYIRFRFKINLHIDDIEVLKTIQSKLNIGRIVIEENKNSCAFIVQSFS